MTSLNIAIVGATGLVGQTFLKVLAERNVTIANLYLYASQKSAGKTITWCKKKHKVLLLDEANIVGKQIDYALFSAGEAVSRAFAPVFKKYGAIVIDNSSAFRMDPSVPLVVPEVNGKDIYLHDGIISNPNCSTIQCMLPLKLLDTNYYIDRVNFTTFQSVSGSGMKGISDLNESAKGHAPTFYPHPIYNNCLPHIGSFDDTGYTKEEIKMIKETRKILSLPALKISATCVRVPVMSSHSIAIDVHLKKRFNVEDIRKMFASTKGLILMDDPQNNIYPLATDATGQDDILVGRIRKDLDDAKTLHFFCVADNIRKGAATNAVQILEYMEGRD